jgi:hypothetical protein
MNNFSSAGLQTSNFSTAGLQMNTVSLLILQVSNSNDSVEYKSNFRHSDLKETKFSSLALPKREELRSQKFNFNFST